MDSETQQYLIYAIVVVLVLLVVWYWWKKRSEAKDVPAASTDVPAVKK